jgi:hypothetical protein
MKDIHEVLETKSYVYTQHTYTHFDLRQNETVTHVKLTPLHDLEYVHQQQQKEDKGKQVESH